MTDAVAQEAGGQLAKEIVALFLVIDSAEYDGNGPIEGGGYRL